MLTTKNAVGKKLFCFLLPVIFLAGCTPPGARALLHGKRLMDGGRYAEAVEELRVAASVLSTNAQAWNYLGLACHYTGQSTNAAQAYQRALALNHDLAEAHYNLGCLWLEQNRLDFARSELTTYTSLRRNSVEGWVKLGTAQLRSFRSANGQTRPLDLAAAEKSYGEALRLNSQNPEALNGLGLAQIHRSHPREAVQYFDHALKQQPDYGPALLNLAIVSQLYLDNRPLALQKYREYLALPGHLPNLEAVGAAARGLAQELNPAPRPPVTNVPAPAAVVTNQPRPAVNATAHAAIPSRTEPATNSIKSVPAPAPPAQNVELVRLAPDPTAKPAQDISSTPHASSAAQTKSGIQSPKAAIMTPKAGTQAFSSRMLRRNSKTNAPGSALPAGAGSASSAAAVSPSNTAATPSESKSTSVLSGVARYPYHLPPKPVTGDASAAEGAFAQGVQAQQKDHLPEAIQAYRRATQLDPACYDAYYNLGLAAMATGNVQQALVAYEYAMAIRPESPDARYNFALGLKKADYLADALNELEKLLSTYPKEPRAHLALGNIYAQQLLQPAMAREHYLKVLENDPHNPQGESIRYWLIANPP
jgi:tetratricopeptide (TPR) repeat protein